MNTKEKQILGVKILVIMFINILVTVNAIYGNDLTLRALYSVIIFVLNVTVLKIVIRLIRVE